MWDSREKYDAYLAFREESGELGEFEAKYYTADPQWKYMPVLMDFNKQPASKAKVTALWDELTVS